MTTQYQTNGEIKHLNSQPRTPEFFKSKEQESTFQLASPFKQDEIENTSLVLQWLRICQSMQGT